MFYSHQLLARKGPLGTVWIAAHQKKKLNKSQINAINIISCIDGIMCPEVPIALRMSGQLLFGVVWIYSRKVRYLCIDSNVISMGLSSPKVINLSENAINASAESVTLPKRYELDAMDSDDDSNNDGDEDIFRRTQEEITLQDQIPVGSNYYTAIRYDEQEAASNPGGRSMEDEDECINPLNTNVGIQDPGPTNQTPSVNVEFTNSPQSVPEMEVMRDAVHDFQTIESRALFEFQNNFNEPHVATSKNQVIRDKEILSQPLGDILHTGGQSSFLGKHLEGPVPVTSANVPEIFDTRVSYGHTSVDLVLRSSPPVEQQQPKPKARKRKQIDETIVLKNSFMKKALQDTGDISRKRRPVPASILGDWKLRTVKKRKRIFDEPSIFAICPDLHDIFTRDFITSKAHLVISEPMTPQSMDTVANMESEVSVQPPVHAPGLDQITETENQVSGQSPVRAPGPDKNLEHFSGAESPACSSCDIEVLRENVGTTDNNVLPDLMTSHRGFMGSPVRRNDDFTTISADYLGTDAQGGTTDGTTEMYTPSMTGSMVPFGSEMETSLTFPKKRFNHSDIPEVINSAEAWGLNFLGADKAPASSKGAQNVDGLSVRTRAVAQFLKSHSPVAQVPENPTDDLSLNKILEGKTKKICARMFYETLVLKSYGLVDALQQDPYGDITLKLTPKLAAQL